MSQTGFRVDFHITYLNLKINELEGVSLPHALTQNPRVTSGSGCHCWGPGTSLPLRGCSGYLQIGAGNNGTSPPPTTTVNDVIFQLEALAVPRGLSLSSILLRKNFRGAFVCARSRKPPACSAAHPLGTTNPPSRREQRRPILPPEQARSCALGSCAAFQACIAPSPTPGCRTTSN